MSRRRKPIIAIDWDDVVVQTTAAICRIHSRRSGALHRASDMISHDFCNLWGTGIDYVIQVMDEHFSSGATQKPRFLPGAVEVLRELSLTHRLAVVTARHVRWDAVTKEQVQALGCRIYAIHLCTDENGFTTDKALICREYGYETIIDDHVSTTNMCAAAGIQSFVFGRYQWNRHGKIPLVRRAYNWRHVHEILLSKPRD
ncbi:MAG: hypothetical protein Q7S57_05285 [bacterium]|nr:hypothetical protein [bacterium]